MSSLKPKAGTGRRVVNLRAAAILLVVAGAMVFGVRKVHDRQMSRTLHFLRSTALKSLEAKDYRAARLQLTQYLAMKSNDLDAREKLSWVLTEHIKTQQALEQACRINEELLRQGMSNDELRLRHARINVRLKRHSDADAHLKLLQQSRPDDAEVWYLSAVVAHEARDAALAMKHLKRSLRCPVKIPESYEFMANLATEESPAELQPATLMAEMIQKCPSGKSYHIRADYFVRLSQFEQAVSDLWKALDETPDDLILNAKLARCLQAEQVADLADSQLNVDARGLLLRAVKHFEERIESVPQNATYRIYLATILWKAKERQRAIATLEAGIQILPRAFILHETLIEYLVAEQQPARARRILEAIPAGALSREVYHYVYGRILMAEDRWKEAASSLEKTIAFARKDSPLLSRTQMSYAVCRSRNGESNAALEVFRTVLASHPDSTAAKLGIAAALVQSDQFDLAIAEYRHLQDIPHVRACMADLIIRRNLNQSASLRNWEELDELIREDKPQIADPVQRTLLRADRHFATGQLLTAIQTLEHAAVLHPHRPEVESALKRLRGELAPAIHDRLTQLAQEDPSNTQVLAALFRHTLIINGLGPALEMLDNSRPTRSTASDDQENWLLLKLETLSHAQALELRSVASPFAAELDELAVDLAKQLATLNPRHERELVRTLIRSGRSSEVLPSLAKESETSRPELRAAALLEAVKMISTRSEMLPAAATILHSLVTRHPQNLELRIYYAEMMLYGRQYALAEQILEPLHTAAKQDARIPALRAWLRSAQDSDLSKAADLAATAVQIDNSETVFQEVQARVLLSRNEPEKSLQILTDLPADRLTIAGQVYLVMSLWKLGRESEAQSEFDQIHPVDSFDALMPADEDLLKTISDQILHPTTASR